MKHEVNRNVIIDLWPLYQTNEISVEGRALVEEFLAQDPELADVLRESRRVSPVMPGLHLSPDQERLLLDEARARARLKLLIFGGATAVTGLVLIIALIAIIFLMFGGSA